MGTVHWGLGGEPRAVSGCFFLFFLTRGIIMHKLLPERIERVAKAVKGCYSKILGCQQ